MIPPPVHLRPRYAQLAAACVWVAVLVVWAVVVWGGVSCSTVVVWEAGGSAGAGAGGRRFGSSIWTAMLGVFHCMLSKAPQCPQLLRQDFDGVPHSLQIQIGSGS